MLEKDMSKWQNMSKWHEIRSDHYDDIEDVQIVVAWGTNKGDEEDGKVIAKIHLDTNMVDFIDPDARYDGYARKVITEVLRKKQRAKINQ